MKKKSAFSLIFFLLINILGIQPISAFTFTTTPIYNYITRLKRGILSLNKDPLNSEEFKDRETIYITYLGILTLIYLLMAQRFISYKHLVRNKCSEINKKITVVNKKMDELEENAEELQFAQAQLFADQNIIAHLLQKAENHYTNALNITKILKDDDLR